MHTADNHRSDNTLHYFSSYAAPQLNSRSMYAEEERGLHSMPRLADGRNHSPKTWLFPPESPNQYTSLDSVIQELMARSRSSRYQAACRISIVPSTATPSRIATPDATSPDEPLLIDDLSRPNRSHITQHHPAKCYLILLMPLRRWAS
jgi:hypothetical protein